MALSETVLCYPSRLSRRVAALQPAGRVPTRGWFAGLSRAGYHPDSGSHLRRDLRPSGPSFGHSPVGKLGGPEDKDPPAGQHLELENSNFAEVGNSRRNLIPTARHTTSQSLQEVHHRSISEFRMSPAGRLRPWILSRKKRGKKKLSETALLDV